jgi:lysophospholipase L1-like esterase
MLAAAVLLMPALLSAARAQGPAQAAQTLAARPDNPGAPAPAAAPSDRPAAAPDRDATDKAATDKAATANPPSQPQQANAAPQRGLAEKAIDRVKQVARSASDIFNRVPCLPPKGEPRAMGSLPHVATKLAAGQSVVIVAFGSSSTAGYGSSSPEFTYPNRLAAQLRRQYPTADITVVNRGKGGDDAPEMMRRLQTEVLDMHPDLVIWQVGTNAVLRNLDPDETARQVEEGVGRIQAVGADIVLVDPQYSPKVTERAESAGKMVRLLGRVATLRHVGIFPRFEIMRDWHERQAIPIDDFVIADGLHMNDWGYACFAQLLGDDIIKSVGQVKLGVAVPSSVLTYRPM